MCKELQTNIYIANDKYTIQNNIPLKSVAEVKMFALTGTCEAHCTRSLDQCIDALISFLIYFFPYWFVDRQNNFSDINFIRLTCRLADLRSETLCDVVHSSL